MIQPTVGRVVWYRASANDARPHEGDQPLAAQIVAVHSDTLVNLGVFDRVGVPFSRLDVVLVNDEMTEEDRPLDGYAEWMPYQKGQAAKTDEALKKAQDNAAG